MNKNPIMHISRQIERCYSKFLMLALLVAATGFFWLFNFSTLPISNPALIKLSGEEGLLDLMPFYSAQDALMALNHYGTEGRELYLRFLAADFIFIQVYSFGFAFLMTRTILAVKNRSSHWLWLNVLPLGIGLFDCVENLSILGMLKLYPEPAVVLGTLSGVFTLCKHLLTLGTILALGYFGIVLVLRKFGLKVCVTH